MSCTIHYQISYHLHEYQISYHLHELLVQLTRRRGINSPTFARLAMAARVVFLLALYKTFSGVPVPFCIDLAVSSKCLEQKKQQHLLSKNNTSSPNNKIKNTPAVLC